VTETNTCPKIIPASNSGVYQGAFVGDNITETNVVAYEKMSGESLDIGLKFLAFETGLHFPVQEAKVMGKRGGALLIKLESWAWKGKDDNSFPLEKILAGKYDHLLKKFAQGAKAYGKPVFVSFDHEMNLPKSARWYPWAGNPKLYKKAFRYVHDKISQEYGACNITWVWNPNIDFESLKAYYPGSEYVDWVAIDGYNTEDWGANWKSCKALFSPSLPKLRSFGKPIMIGEFASDENTLQDTKVRKPAFLSQCIPYFAQEKVGAFVYFNVDKNEGGAPKEWAIDSPQAQKAYSAALNKHEALFKKRIITTMGKTAPKIAQAKVGAETPKPPKESPAIGKVSALSLGNIAQSTFGFNSGTVTETGGAYVFFAKSAKDPGFGILTANHDVSKYSRVKFDVKGNLSDPKPGGWVRFIAQVYSYTDNDYTPSVILDPVDVTDDFSTVTVDLKGMKQVKKVQFLLVTNNGSCKIEVKNIRFE